MPSGSDIQHLRPDYWFYLVPLLAVIATAVWVGVKRRDSTRDALLAAAAILLVRLVLLGNPLCWSFYSRLLDAETVGWRQYDLIQIQRERFVESPAPLRYLAVGSSQADAVFGQYADQHADFDTFIVAAMSPIDLVVFDEEIIRRRPRAVLLYVSDFDIARQPSAEAILVSPQLGSKLPSLARRLHARNTDLNPLSTVVELIVGEALPEFKFRFVFRGIADLCIRRIAARVGRNNAPAPRSTLQERARLLREGMSADFVEPNLLWLQDFLREMRAVGIDVIIVEGHYNPIVANPETRRLNDGVRASLAGLADGTSVRFVPRADVLELKSEDYYDLTHVRAEVGERFARRLVDRLEADAPEGR